jgi:energy-coupling factor transporter ATP-binding protein EcfA2
MILSKVTIHNYRSISELCFDCRKNLVLLGENNSGKSNILSAVEFALSSSSKPAKDDIFAFAPESDQIVWVELTFTELTEQEKTTFQRYVRADGSVCFRKTATFEDPDRPVIQYNGYVQEPLEEWLRSGNISRLANRTAIAATPLADLVPATGRITQAQVGEAQVAYIQQHAAELSFEERLEDSPLLGQRNVAAGVLPDFYLVPAVRDLDDEAKVKSTTVFGKLLSRAIEDMAAWDQRFIQLRNSLGELVASLNAAEGNANRPQQLIDLEGNLQQELSDWGVKVSIEVTPPDIGKIFELGTDLNLDDGHNSLAQRKGHGMQRAVLFGLIKAWARTLRQNTEEEGRTGRTASESMIFAFEEPELFLHPQAQRSLALALRVLSKDPNRQVMLCSHSSHFVDLDNYKDIVLASKSNAQAGTCVRQCTGDLFGGDDDGDRKRRFHMAHWVNPDRGEMFFARKVVFVEGETEKVLLPFLAKQLGCFDPMVSVIDCGSKHNLPLYVTIAEAFQLHYQVVHDEDPLPAKIPDDWSADKIRAKRETFALNRTIDDAIGFRGMATVCKPDCEGLCGVSRAQGKKKGKALAALDHFAELAVEAYPHEFVAVVQQAYQLDGPEA